LTPLRQTVTDWVTITVHIGVATLTVLECTADSIAPQKFTDDKVYTTDDTAVGPLVLLSYGREVKVDIDFLNDGMIQSF